MVKITTIILVVMILAQFFTSTAFASEFEPVGACVTGFDLHPFMEHNGEDMHMHIGIDQDLNGDGFICMKILYPDLHLHLDNTIIYTQ